MSENQTTATGGGVQLRGRVKGLRLKALRRSWLRKRYKLQNGLCAICGGKMQMVDELPAHPRWKASLDHIIPLSKNGPDHWMNTQATHRKCNEEKADA